MASVSSPVWPRKRSTADWSPTTTNPSPSLTSSISSPNVCPSHGSPAKVSGAHDTSFRNRSLPQPGFRLSASRGVGTAPTPTVSTRHRSQAVLSESAPGIWTEGATADHAALLAHAGCDVGVLNRGGPWGRHSRALAARQHRGDGNRTTVGRGAQHPSGTSIARPAPRERDHNRGWRHLSSSVLPWRSCGQQHPWAGELTQREDRCSHRPARGRDVGTASAGLGRRLEPCDERG